MSNMLDITSLLGFPSITGKVNGGPILVFIRWNGKGMRQTENFWVPVTATGKMGAWDFNARYTTPSIPFWRVLSGLRCPSGKITTALSR